MTNPRDFIYALIRTYVPMAVGWGLVWLGQALELAFAEEMVAQLEEFAVVVVAALYYLSVRLLAERWPSFGWLLGVQKAPRYDA